MGATAMGATAMGATAYGNGQAGSGEASTQTNGNANAPLTMASTMPTKNADRLQQIKQLLHLINIAKPDVAASQAQALLDGGLTAADLATLVDENDLGERFDKVMSRGRGMTGVEELAQRFDQMLREGRLELARQPARIDDAIAKLNGTLREQMFARERLDAAGEYAVPKLLQVITSGKDPNLEIAATQVLTSMKHFAVSPLSAALIKLDPINQRKVAEILGDIGYPFAAPFLLEVMNDPKSTGDVKAAATRAFQRVGGTATDTSAQFAELARRYFVGDEALVAYPAETTNNVWSYDAFGGLTLTPVPTSIFREVMAMLMSRKALSFDPANQGALSLYVASDLRRENRLPKEVTDPIFGTAPYTPTFFAMAAGPSVDQTVIGLGIDRKDTALVRDSIAAIAQTAGAHTGGTALVGGGGRQSLLECLRYPEKRVQYEAALAIGAALPDRTFPGDFSIVPLLAGAVRDAGTVNAAVVASSEEDRRQLSGRLSTLGFLTLSGASTFPAFETELASTGGLDLLVVAGSLESTKAAVDAARLAGMTIAAPIVVVVAETELARATRQFELDPGVVVWPANGRDETFKGAVDVAFAHQSGGRITEEEALDYTTRSLEVLKQIAISNSPIFSIRDAEKPLLEALDSRQGGVRLLVADVVALVPGAASQRKLIDSAMASSDEAEKIELLTRAAASARRFGNQTETRQVDALRNLVAQSSGPLAEAAGRLYGALDLSSAETVRLITAPATPVK
ncbi:MAG: HEAT repeat domain-containing protein [Phycisphaerae bacterium]|nr:HEAT repeat domain-containing protein [Phycisphaerae bacterium]